MDSHLRNILLNARVTGTGGMLAGGNYDSDSDSEYGGSRKKGQLNLKTYEKKLKAAKKVKKGSKSSKVKSLEKKIKGIKERKKKNSGSKSAKKGEVNPGLRRYQKFVSKFVKDHPNSSREKILKAWHKAKPKK